MERSSAVGLMVFGALSCWATPQANAQQVSPSRPDAPASDASAGAPTGFGDIVVTAQRRSERLVDVPISITAASAADLTRAGVTNLRDIDAVVPGLTFTAQGAWSEPSIRGVTTTISHPGAEAPTAVYVDGVYHANQVAAIFDLPDVERIEVLKGPQGTLFGRNATAGAISIHTVQPGFTPKGDLSATFGMYTGGGGSHSAPLGRLQGYLSTPIVDNVAAAMLTGFYEKSDGYLVDDLRGGRTGQIEKYLIRFKGLIQPSNDIRLWLTASYSHEKNDTSMTPFPLKGNTTANYYPDSVIPTTPWHVSSPLAGSVSPTRVSELELSLRTEFDIGHIGTLSTVSAYLDTHVHNTTDINGGSSPSCLAVFACILYDVNFPSKSFQQEIVFNSTKFGSLNFTAGAFYYRSTNYEDVNLNPPLNGGVVAGRGFFSQSRIKTKALAGFGEVNWDVTQQLHIIGGIRYSWERKEGFGDIQARFPASGPLVASSWTPRVAVRYEVADNTNVYASYSQGFKSGVLDGSGQTNGFAKPEKLHAYEVGLKSSSRSFSFNGAAFYYDYKDLQFQAFDGVNTFLSNAASAKLYGFEADLQARLTDSLTARAAGSWLPYAKYKKFVGGVDFALPNSAGGMTQVPVVASDTRMLRAPKFSGTFSLDYSTNTAPGKLTANATVYYTSAYDWDLLRRIRTSAYATLNARIALELAGHPGLSVAVFGRNLTNKAYYNSVLNSVFADLAVYSAPRQVGLTIQYKY